MHQIQSVAVKGVDSIYQLVRVSVEVKILQEARSKFTEQEIVCVIDGPEAPVCVVVGTGACTEWTHCPEGSSLPMMVVMCEAGQAGHAARVVVLKPLEEFP